jgi:hypothetical protein
MREYGPAISSLLAWAAYVGGVFWLTRIAAKRAATSRMKLALYAISVAGMVISGGRCRAAAAIL